MTIELLQPHTHAGVLQAPGSRLELDDTAARWLIDRGVARSVASASPPSTPGTPDTPASDRQSATPSRKGD